MKKFLLVLLKAVGALAVLSLILITVFSVSPIYSFRTPRPFSGPNVYNPYDAVSGNWLRACFHVHTKVDNIFNECTEEPDSVLADYRRFGYDIVAFSNHNVLTPAPSDSSAGIPVYEHGFGLTKFHTHVFNPTRLRLYDHAFPILVSQKQWQYDYLGRDADFLMMNHPDRSAASHRAMRLLTGYRLIEGDCGYGTDLRRWDEGLSAGHYSHNLIGDDCHNSRNHRKIARRCVWLDTPSAKWEDVAPALKAGRFYSMRIPDFGKGNWQEKYDGNASLPRIESIGVEGDSVFVSLSAPARIEAWGQGHELLAQTIDTRFSYVLGREEPYVRFTAYFDNGVVLYTNAFARYNARISDTPYVVGQHKVNVLLTVLYNLLLLILLIAELVALFFVVAYKKKKSRLTVEQLRFRGIVP